MLDLSEKVEICSYRSKKTIYRGKGCCRSTVPETHWTKIIFQGVGGKKSDGARPGLNERWNWSPLGGREGAQRAEGGHGESIEKGTLQEVGKTGGVCQGMF